MKVYQKISNKIFDIVKQFAIGVEKVSVDEAYLDISHIDGKYEQYAKFLQKKVYDELGLSMSVGISYTKFLAKTASEWNKPKGIKIITKDMIPKLLFPLDIKKVHGVGEKTAKRLYDMGIYKVEDLYKLDKNLLQSKFKKAGISMYNEIRGKSENKICTFRERKSYGIERTFENDIRNPKDIEKKIDQFSDKLSKDLKSKRYIGKTLSIKIKYSDFSIITRNITLEHPTNDYDKIKFYAKFLYKKIDNRKSIRLLGLSMATLSKEKYKQLSFLSFYT